MLLIRDVVREAFAVGYLTVEAEEQLRQLLRTKYDAKDFRAFMNLQHAVASGIVRQESRERARSESAQTTVTASPPLQQPLEGVIDGVSRIIPSRAQTACGYPL